MVILCGIDKMICHPFTRIVITRSAGAENKLDHTINAIMSTGLEILTTIFQIAYDIAAIIT